MNAQGKTDADEIGPTCPQGIPAHVNLCQPFGKPDAAVQQVTMISHVPLPGLISCQGVDATVGGCAVKCEVETCLLVEHAQQWRLDQLTLGDFVAEISLAPNEQRELETSRMQRSIVEQSREDVTQFELTKELSTTQREAATVSAIASKVNGWRATNAMDLSVGATIPIKAVQINVQGKFSATTEVQSQVTNTTEHRTEHVHESVVKAAEKLTQQTKIMVRSSTETVFSATERRTLRNPSQTDSLHLYAYEVRKSYTVATWPRRVRPALRVRVLPMQFDAGFVAENPGFLTESVFDAQIRAHVDDACRAAGSTVIRSSETAALDVLERLLFHDFDPDFVPDGDDVADGSAVFDLSWPRRQLFDKVRLLFKKDHYARLFDDPHAIFKQSPVPSVEDPAKNPGGSGAKAATKGAVDNTLQIVQAVKTAAMLDPIAGYIGQFTNSQKDLVAASTAPAAALGPPPLPPEDGAFGSRRPSSDGATNGDSGMWEWMQTSASGLVLQWRYLFWLWFAGKTGSNGAAATFWRENRSELLRRYAEVIASQFTGAARAILVDFGETTQLARRLDAYSMIAETAFGPPGSLPSRNGELALTAVLRHLQAHAAAYTERYMQWLEKHMGRAGVAELLDAAVGQANWGSVDYLKSGEDRGIRWFDMPQVRGIGREYFVPLTAPADAKSDFGTLLRPAIKVMQSLTAGMTAGEQAVKAAIAGLGPAETVDEQIPWAPKDKQVQDQKWDHGGQTTPSVPVPKVVVTKGVHVLADGVHVVAAASKC